MSMFLVQNVEWGEGQAQESVIQCACQLIITCAWHSGGHPADEGSTAEGSESSCGCGHPSSLSTPHSTQAALPSSMIAGPSCEPVLAIHSDDPRGQYPFPLLRVFATPRPQILC